MSHKLVFALALFHAISSAPLHAATKTILTADMDTVVSEAAPDHAGGTAGVLNAGIGRGLQEGKVISYIRFDLRALPASTLLRRVVIESAQLRLFAQSYGLAAREERFFVTVSACETSDWSEQTMTWNSRPCARNRKGEDSAVITGTGLPAVYTWDVARSVAEAHAKGRHAITFVVDAFLLKPGDREIVPGSRFGPHEEVGFVRFWSRERLDYGVTAIPTLSISHSSSSTQLLTFLSSIAAILSALGVALAIYETASRLRKARNC